MTSSSNSNSAALDSAATGDTSGTLSNRLVWLAPVALVLLIVSWRFAEVDPGLLFRLATIAAVWHFLRDLFPPDLSADFLRIVAWATTQTIATAAAGTLLSIALALPLGILATSTLWRRGVLVSAQARSLGFRIGAIAGRLARAVLGFLRAVPDLMWALLFVAAVGLGPLAGTLALTISYTGMVGRVYADVFEHVDPQPLEALQSTGASRLQIFLRGIWPQALPHIVAYSLYSFECCVRAAAVLGFVGAGGIGYELSVSMKLFEYGQVLTLLLVLIALLAVTDVTSRWVRKHWVNNLQENTRGPAPVGEPYGWKSSTNGLGRFVAFGIIAILLAACFPLAGFTSSALSTVGFAESIVSFLRRALPPDLSWGFVGGLGIALLQTIAISLMGVVIGIVLAIVLAIPATSTLMLAPSDSPGKVSSAERSLRWLLFWAARLVLNVLRSIPELVWVLICVLAVGIGPFAGAIALGLHTAGVLGKLYAETMEEVPLRPIEALRSLGARPLQILFWAVWPQARPILSSYTVLRWEMNLRAATILGLVGGGGLGQAIYNNVQLGFYPRLSTLILLIYALVIASDWIGEKLRLRVA
jgi:phosphonate transport system permease protein